MFFHKLQRHRKPCMMNMDHMMDSNLLKALAVGAIVYVGAKTIRHMMEE